MSQFNRKPYATGITNEQQLYQSDHAIYNYCKVMRAPKLGAAPVVITVLEGLIITLLLAATGMGLWKTVIIGGFFTALFAFLCRYVYRYRTGATKRINSYLAEDGGRRMFSDFDSAQPFVDDQFRLGSYYLFIKNGTVLRIDSIADIVRVNTYAGVYLSVSVKDENGSMTLPLCRVHILKSRTEIDEIRKAVMQRQKYIEEGWDVR